MNARKNKAIRKRRVRGTGSIFWSATRKVWVARVPVGERTDGGYTRYRELSDRDQRRLVERMRQVAPPGPDTTVAEWASRWLEHAHVRDSTREGYASTVKNFILPGIGHLRVAALTTPQCANLVRQWAGIVKPGTVKLYLGRLRNLLGAARRAGLCQSNPAADVRAAKPPRRRLVPLAPAELARLVRASLANPWDWPIALLASTGCRVGEALALDVEDWDANAGTIDITKTWTRKHGSRPPKSENGVRTIRVPVEARPALVKAAGNRATGPLFLVYGARHRRYHESVRVAFAALLKRLGLAKRNLHQLRHAVASALVAAGEPLADLSEFLGDRLETVVATYVHATGRDVSQTMDRLLSGAQSGRGRENRRKTN